VAADEGIPGKPAPDTYLRGAELLGVPAEHCVVIEDAVSGVQAGAAGGFATVVGVDRGAGRAALTDAGADLVVVDLAELVPAAADVRCCPPSLPYVAPSTTPWGSPSPAASARPTASTSEVTSRSPRSTGPPTRWTRGAGSRPTPAPRRWECPRRSSPWATATWACAGTPRRVAPPPTTEPLSTASTRRGTSSTPRTRSGWPARGRP